MAAITSGTLAGITAFGLRDTSAAFDLTIAATSTTPLTAARSVTIDCNNASHALKFTAASTITFPSGTNTLFGSAVANTSTANGAVSAPAFSLTGTIYSGGTATTTKPLFLVEPAGTTSAGWSTGGTLLGLNGTSVSQDLVRGLVNGAMTFAINGYGSMVLGSNISPGTGMGLVMIGSQHGSNNKNFGLLTGYGGRMNWDGERVICTGYLVDWGDAQTRETVIRATTTNNTATEMTGYGGQRLTLANDTTFAFEVLIAARRGDANDESAGYLITGVIDRNAAANTTALVGTPTVTVLGEDTAAWDVSATADTTNGSLRISVTGETSKTIGWVGSVKLTQVTI